MFVEMTKAGIFVCLVIVFADAAAGILSIQAEIVKDKVTDIKKFECQRPNHQAFNLGLAAATLLALSHVVTSLLGACMCICCTKELERSSKNLQFCFACLVLSWIAVAAGFPTLVMGMLENSKSKGLCQVLHHRFLLVGGIFCFVHGFFSAVFYISATISFDNGRSHGLEVQP